MRYARRPIGGEAPEFVRTRRSPSFSFLIVRILGNELSPRDTPGSRLDALRQTLDNEPPLPKATKAYILNTIHDDKLRRNYLQLLEAAQRERDEVADIVELPFRVDNYRAATTDRERLRWAVNLNEARNLALDHWASKADYILVADGDCFLELAVWNDITEVAERHGPDVISIPTARCVDGVIPPAGAPTTEPQVMFRSPGEIRFKDHLEFGRDDKRELLGRIGYDARTLTLRHHIHTMATGRILHYATGQSIAETSTRDRLRLRKESIQRLLLDIDSQYGLADTAAP